MLEYLLANRGVARVHRRRFSGAAHQSLDDVAPADNSDDLALPNDWNAFDPIFFKEHSKVAKWCVLRCGHNVARHYLGYPGPICFDELARPRLRQSEQFEPPRAPALCANLGTAHQVTFADDPDEHSIFVDNRHCANSVLQEKHSKLLNSVLW